MYLILQQQMPDDYVIATGITTEVREFIRRSFALIGVEIFFAGEKEDETGSIKTINDTIFLEMVGKEHLDSFKSRIRNNPVVVKIDPAYYRPTEVDLLLGDPKKAREKLGWIPEYDLDGLIRDMVTSDIILMKRENYLKKGGFSTYNYFE
jgi:GDPmannose 4,6-dehydratase